MNAVKQVKDTKVLKTAPHQTFILEGRDRKFKASFLHHYKRVAHPGIKLHHEAASLIIFPAVNLNSIIKKSLIKAKSNNETLPERRSYKTAEFFVAVFP